MAGTDADWERYGRWNEAIADVVYTRDAAGTPVYLDLEEGPLDEIGRLAEPDAECPSAALADAVKGTLVLRYGPADVLRGHLRRLETWQKGPMTDPPPTLALLAALSLAAENMHEGEGKASNNFYARLAELLHLTDVEIQRLTTAYQRSTTAGPVSKQLWGSLSDWLETIEGNRGQPTARASGHAHIGLPLSQALVRQGDRDKLGAMFAAYGLPPHGSLPPDVMEQVIGEWMSRTPCPLPHHLERMWRQSAARERIVEVALQTLEAWDGQGYSDVGGSAGGPAVDAVRARAILRSFPKRLLEVSLLVPAGSPGDETVEVLDEQDNSIAELELVPASSGWLTLADPHDIDASSFLGGRTNLRRPGQAQPLRRRPRRIVPLRHDDLLQSFVECERVQLGEDLLVLARSEVAAQVATLLQATARPGFTHHTGLDGLPNGWELFQGVQVLSSLPKTELAALPADLNVLVPLATSQVVLQGGLLLPGNIRKWSSAMPPELRASTEQGGLRATLTCTRPLAIPTPIDRQVVSGNAVLIWDLQGESLPDGDYEITVTSDGEEVGYSHTIRLRSADHPAIILEAPHGGHLAHDPSRPGFGLLATRTHSPAAICGAPGEALGAGAPLDKSDGLSPIGAAPTWVEARTVTPKARAAPTPVQFPDAGASTCFATGAHHWLLETAVKGKSSVEGVCRHCGLARRYPTRFKAKKEKAGAAKQVAPQIQLEALHPVTGPSTVDWRAGFDAVSHLGAGPPSALERIATQMEPSALFSDSFARRLEALGHIEIERDPNSLQPLSWEAVDPIIAGLPDGRATLVGFRSDHMLAAVEDFVYEAGGSVLVDEAAHAPPVIIVEGLTAQALHELSAAIEATTHRKVSYSADAAMCLASMLQPLSEALEGLPTIPLPGARGFEQWNPTTARFEPATHAGSSGAYRLTGFVRAYIFRRPTDLASTTAVLGDARIVKHAAALESRIALVGYDAPTESLYVPLGADLPGLYGRSAALASGHPPIEDEKKGVLVYRDVPAVLAARLATLLMS